MYLKKTYRKDSGRTYLVLAKKYRDPSTGISKDRTIKSLGYLDELEKEYENPIAYFKQEALRMTQAEKEKQEIILKIDMEETLRQKVNGIKNLGYAVPLSVYHELELDTYLRNKSRSEGFQFNASSILTLLVITRLLSPGSKKRAYEEKARYFERFQFTLDDVYRSLTYLKHFPLWLQK